MPNSTVPAAATAYSARPSHLKLGSRIVVELTGTVLGRDGQTGHHYIQPDDPQSSSIHVLPEYIFPIDGEPTIAVTDGGRAFLLLRSIIDRLHVEGDTATFTLTPELADELAAFGSESEDLEQDDEPEAEPDEDGHDNEKDVWVAEDQDDEKAVQVQLAGRLEPKERPAR
jgi:hypothetical protein